MAALRISSLKLGPCGARTGWPTCPKTPDFRRDWIGRDGDVHLFHFVKIQFYNSSNYCFPRRKRDLLDSAPVRITMSSATKRKYVFQELDDMTLPTDSQSIVRIVQARGHNLHEVVTPTGEQFIVSMPTKFRQNIWVKRGDYIVIEPIMEGKKVKGEIVKILTKDHIKWYRAQNCWPPEFDEDPKRNGHSIPTNYTKCDDEELFVNTNRCPTNQKISDNESDSDSSESDSH
ncbi:probable RNA-binding protein EIF1AD isoform X2 [Temnothorax curvispinosus]|uniref:Probable RNA-binding protein EIF1AD n=1 Tax=Temnothorax curvispinosus TaxID=300111 RepID=A0A6J1R3R1_9HYME|nr:probable RNA-binding protein EIF1AD isoform X2 [Temnothorax curvispinosus]